MTGRWVKAATATLVLSAALPGATACSSSANAARCQTAQAEMRSHAKASSTANANGDSVTGGKESAIALQIILDEPRCFRPDDVAAAHRLLNR